MNNPKELETALDALRDYFQTAHRDLEKLRDVSGAHEQRTGEMATALETVRQELRTVQETATLLETTLHAQTAAAREQGEAQARELATLNDRQQAHGQELADHAQTLANTQEQLRTVQEAATLLETTLHAQTAAAREQGEAQARELAALNDRQQAHGQELADRAQALAGTQEQQLGEVTKAIESFRAASQEKMAHFDHRLAAQAEQFGKFESVIRELHGELVVIHQRLTVLETTASPDLLATHSQRLDQTEQQVLEQRQTLNELQQALERLESREPVPAKANTMLLGIGLAVFLTAVLVLISLNTHIFK
ncbi:MAG: hypothetical protein P9E24_15880 [Candidatus Competibacter sp.]|nr:hypothetical protein [Candidatus Competibacter sp.]MDG4583084.1 hypothetical protein [Candidatus Competibacter sp.]